MLGYGTIGERLMSKSAEPLTGTKNADLLRYFMSPFAVALWVTALICDLVYPIIFAQVRKTERLLPDGRRVAGDSVNIDKKRVTFDKVK